MCAGVPVCREIWVLLCVPLNVHRCMCVQEFQRKFDIGGFIYFLNVFNSSINSHA